MEREGAHACREELHVAVEQREEGAAGPRPHTACDLLGREGRKGGGCIESEEMATVGRSP